MESKNSENYVVTIGRQFGSGGREFGKSLAKVLGICYYDKELLVQAAQKAGMNEEFFEKNDERSPSFLSGLLWFNMGANPTTHYLGSNSISDDTLYRSLSEIIRQLSLKGSCVIVGRSADYVLRDMDRVFNIFVHAPEEDCIKRIMGRKDVDEYRKAVEKMKRVNRLRSSFYNFYTDKRWGHASSYDLCIDTSLMPIDQTAKLVAEIIKARFNL